MKNPIMHRRTNITDPSTPARTPTINPDELLGESLAMAFCGAMTDTEGDGAGGGAAGLTMKYWRANGEADCTSVTLMTRVCAPAESPDAEKSGWLSTRSVAIGSAVTTGAAASMEYAAVGGACVALLAGMGPNTVIPVPLKLKDKEDPTTSVWCEVWKNPSGLSDQDVE